MLLEDEDGGFQDYYARKQRGYEGTVCGASCKALEFCRLRSIQSQFGCFPEHQGLGLRRRGGEGEGGGGGEEEWEECSGSIRAVQSLRGMIF